MDLTPVYGGSGNPSSITTARNFLTSSLGSEISNRIIDYAYDASIDIYNDYIGDSTPRGPFQTGALDLSRPTSFKSRIIQEYGYYGAGESHHDTQSGFRWIKRPSRK